MSTIPNNPDFCLKYICMIGVEYVTNVRQNELDGFDFELVPEYSQCKHISHELKDDFEKYLSEAGYNDVAFVCSERVKHLQAN